MLLHQEAPESAPDYTDNRGLAGWNREGHVQTRMGFRSTVTDGDRNAEPGCGQRGDVFWVKFRETVTGCALDIRNRRTA
jgi:hypothetical protein